MVPEAASTADKANVIVGVRVADTSEVMEPVGAVLSNLISGKVTWGVH